MNLTSVPGREAGRCDLVYGGDPLVVVGNVAPLICGGTNREAERLSLNPVGFEPDRPRLVSLPSLLKVGHQPFVTCLEAAIAEGFSARDRGDGKGYNEDGNGGNFKEHRKRHLSGVMRAEGLTSCPPNYTAGGR